MSLLERNAAGFHYRVTYWPVDITSKSSLSVSASVHRLYDWTASELVVAGQRTFQPFVVFVQAANDEGDAPISFLEKRVGYTGQDGTLCSLCFLYLCIKNMEFLASSHSAVSNTLFI